MRFRSSAILLVALSLSACHATPRVGVVPAAPPREAAVAGLADDIQAILDRPAVARATWGILVKSLRHDDEALYALNPGKLLMPGSSLKILTLAVAADQLGWNYSYQTDLVAGGRVDDGVLEGDLLAVGSGDPSITAASHLVETWADALASDGIRAIAGRVVGDDNTFDDERFGPGWTWEDLADRDGAGVSALQFNENVVQATIVPGPDVGRAASIELAPATSGLAVENRVTTATAGTPPAIEARRPAGTNHLTIRGSVPLGGAPIARLVSVENPTLFFATALRQALVQRGVTVIGAAADIDDIADAPPRTGTPLVAYSSPPLSTLAVRLMKDSDNLYAESLLKTLGAAAGTPTWDAALGIERTVLDTWGIPADEVVQVDGSGLSRYNYITPQALVAVLTHVDRDERLRGPFEASLPVAGRDGTLAGRLQGSAAENNARAKTGSLANARSIAGFVTSADGEPLVFAILANNYGTHADAAVDAIDAIVARLARFSR